MVIKEKKGYEYIPKLMAVILNARRTDKMTQVNRLSQDDPRRLAPTIAKLPSRSTNMLVEEKMSRFKK